MRFVQLALWLRYILGNDLSKYCYAYPPFTGFKFQVEISSTQQYTLIYCHDNKLIVKSDIDTLDQPFIMGNDQLFIVKSADHWIPHKLLGSLIINNQVFCPLLSDNWFKSWLEVKGNGITLHIPVLTSPAINSKYYPS